VQVQVTLPRLQISCLSLQEKEHGWIWREKMSVKNLLRKKQDKVTPKPLPEHKSGKFRFIISEVNEKL